MAQTERLAAEQAARAASERHAASLEREMVELERHAQVADARASAAAERTRSQELARSAVEKQIEAEAALSLNARAVAESRRVGASDTCAVQWRSPDSPCSRSPAAA